MADTTGLLVNAAACAFGFGVLHYVLQQLAQKLHPSDGPKARHEWANYVISCGQAAISGFAGAMGLLFEEPFASAFYQVCAFYADIDTVHGHSTTLKVAMPIILGYFIYDLLLAAVGCGAEFEMLMVLHHCLCVIIWPISYHYQAGCFYVLYMMAAELSTPFLWLVVYFLPKYKVAGSAYTGLGLLMVLVFFSVRILPGPALLKSLLASQSYWNDVNRVVYVLAMITLPLPTLLFAYWFSRILGGMFAALTSDKKDT